MDPGTAIGLALSVQQLLKSLLEYSQDIKNAKKEVRQLSAELSMLKAVLEQVKMILDPAQEVDGMDEGSPILLTPNLGTDEFRQMIVTTESLLEELQSLLQPEEKDPSRFQMVKKAIQRARWSFDKKEAEDYLKRVERAKTWFILALTSDDTAICREMYLRLYSIEKNVQSLESHREKQKLSQLKSSMTAWLAPCNSFGKYKQSLGNLQTGTGEWFLDGVCQEWKSGTLPPILWLKAKPGFGKTTLMAAAVNRAQRVDQSSPVPAVAYFFCSFSEQQSQDPGNILGSLIVQLCGDDISFWRSIDEKYHCQENWGRGHDERMKVEDLEELLLLVLARIGPSLIFVDAVNESRDCDSVLNILSKIAEQCTGTRILLSSTEDTAIRATGVASSAASSSLVSFVAIQKEANSRDIRTYIDAELSKRDKLCRLPDLLKEEIARKLQKKAGGVFRWVQCQLDNLSDIRRTRTIKDVRIALEGLPSTLEQTYGKILRRIVEEDDAELVRSALLWLCFSFQPLKFEELAEAVVIPEEGGEITNDDRLRSPEELLRACGSLISCYDTNGPGVQTGYVTLGHSSVREYLTSENLKDSSLSMFYFDPQTSDTVISRLCLNYLLQPALSSGCCRSPKALSSRILQSPLLGYIKDTLWEHLFCVDVDGPLQPLLSQFLQSQRLPGGGNFGAWVQTFYRQTQSTVAEETTALYFAAREGILPLVRMILAVDGTRDLEKPGGRNRSTPLHVASWAGHTSVVAELLAAGADVHEHASDSNNGLYYAIIGGSITIERMLRDAGATLDERKEKSAAEIVKIKRCKRSFGKPPKESTSLAWIS
ncbi:hypothetical protein MMC10_006367 [Thelotrema lepadinum]|nr:hypothetical protein [Thelotrema lepadinum]